MIHHNRANRRYARHKAISRKKYISNHVYGFDWYSKDGKYSKGKIHCSCPLCRYFWKYNPKKLKEDERFYEQLDELNTLPDNAPIENWEKYDEVD